MSWIFDLLEKMVVPAVDVVASRRCCKRACATGWGRSCPEKSYPWSAESWS